jgi:ubiquinone/menaquinone biosynthesis C-methylase UbiE
MNQVLTAKDQLSETRAAFEQPDWYLRSRGYNIRIRSEVVRAFVQKARCENVLDIGCGNGSISLPLLTPNNRLTLLDLSSTMLSIARSRVPEELVGRVETVNKSFMDAELEPRSCDLILCIGVLAYIEDLRSFCSKLASLLRPGGVAIVECTDASHFVNYFVAGFERVRTLILPAIVPLCLRSSTAVETTFQELGLQQKGLYRYALPLPIVRKCFSQEFHYRTVHSLFGPPLSNRNSWLGNECIYRFVKEG